MLFAAISAITLALVFYSIGVWGEKLGGVLKKWHITVFWAGFVCDTAGTTLMGKIANGGFQLNFHGLTGLAAIILMLVHAVWATAVIAKGSDEAKRSFHKFSIFVWLVWLVPYISGMVAGMLR